MAVIDYFKMPNDSGFGFDSYGQVINSSEIFGGIANLVICGSARDSSTESGARRGTGYVRNTKKVPNYLEIFKGLRSIIHS